MRTNHTVAALVSLAAICVSLGCSKPNTPTRGQKPQAKPVASRAAQPAETPQETPEYEVQAASATARITELPPAVEPPVDLEPTPLAAQTRRQSPAAPINTAPNWLDDSPVGPLEMPAVHLSEDHAKTCLVKVGDPFPDLKLHDLEQADQSLFGLLGSRLTIVAFWNGRQPMAREELADLASNVFQKFGPGGVSIVAINSGDQPELARELADQAGVKFPVLLDADGQALAKVATSKSTRTYLLDARSTVLWFDLEYSRSTRRGLSQAIRYSLTQAGR